MRRWSGKLIIKVRVKVIKWENKHCGTNTRTNIKWLWVIVKVGGIIEIIEIVGKVGIGIVGKVGVGIGTEVKAMLRRRTELIPTTGREWRGTVIQAGRGVI